MFWFWPNSGWVLGLFSGLFWIAVIVAAVLLLRREVPHLGRPAPSHALRILEERYARGEISRDEFLERREVLLRASRPAAPPPPVGPPPSGSEPTVQLPDGSGEGPAAAGRSPG